MSMLPPPGANTKANLESMIYLKLHSENEVAPCGPNAAGRHCPPRTAAVQR